MIRFSEVFVFDFQPNWWSHQLASWNVETCILLVIQILQNYKIRKHLIVKLEMTLTTYFEAASKNDMWPIDSLIEPRDLSKRKKNLKIWRTPTSPPIQHHNSTRQVLWGGKARRSGGGARTEARLWISDAASNLDSTPRWALCTSSVLAPFLYAAPIIRFCNLVCEVRTLDPIL